jgi:hypothetical protein
MFPEHQFSLIGKTNSPLHHNFLNVAGTHPLADSNQFHISALQIIFVHKKQEK